MGDYQDRPWLRLATERALPGAELRTGDVGCMDDDGWFSLVDRGA
jgi:acyl-CoA synthetase (AMP-forming)/AMP-acid ligase II